MEEFDNKTILEAIEYENYLAYFGMTGTDCEVSKEPYRFLCTRGKKWWREYTSFAVEI
jgi:hypothetical protein